MMEQGLDITAHWQKVGSKAVSAMLYQWLAIFPDVKDVTVKRGEMMIS